MGVERVGGGKLKMEDKSVCVCVCVCVCVGFPGGASHKEPVWLILLIYGRDHRNIVKQLFSN